ncbi:hypothetical protein ERJ75_001652900 [Trypanosoma vivax]|nr:hypothetical protein ERJ75_001652900 [Trypanosoma vivax]
MSDPKSLSVGVSQEQQAEMEMVSRILPNQPRHEVTYPNVLKESTRSSRSNSGQPQERRFDMESAGTYFNVLSADKSKALSIPSELIEPTVGSKNYLSRNRSTKIPSFALYLCKSYSNSRSCTHGNQCDFIHSRHNFVESRSENLKVSEVTVHWSLPVSSVSEAMYERHEPGFLFTINQGHNRNVMQFPNSTPNTIQVPSEHVYKTKGSEEAQQSDVVKVLRFCKHYEREKCGRGVMCNFIHRVHFVSRSPQMPMHSQHMRHSYRPNYVGGFNNNNNNNNNNGNLGAHPYQSRGNFRSHHGGNGNNYVMNGLHVHSQHGGSIPFGNCGPMQGRDGLVVPPPSQYHHQQAHHQTHHQQQQHQHHHHHLHHQQTRVLNSSHSYSYGPVYTSRPASYTNNPQSELSGIPLSNSSSYFTQRQHQDPQPVPPVEVSRQTNNQRSSASDYLISPVLVTYM